MSILHASFWINVFQNCGYLYQIWKCAAVWEFCYSRQNWQKNNLHQQDIKWLATSWLQLRITLVMMRICSGFLPLLLSWKAQDTFCKGNTTGGIARGNVAMFARISMGKGGVTTTVTMAVELWWACLVSEWSHVQILSNCSRESQQMSVELSRTQ